MCDEVTCSSARVFVEYIAIMAGLSGIHEEIAE